MGPGEAIIAFIVIGLPVIAVFLLVSRVLKHREKKLELEAQIASAQASKPEYTRQLEQRVRVLERIVTDRGSYVADEIESLREERPN